MRRKQCIGLILALSLLLCACASANLAVTTTQTADTAPTAGHPEPTTESTVPTTEITSPTTTNETTVPETTANEIVVPLVTDGTQPPEETTEPSASLIPAVSAGFGDVYLDICRLLDTGSWDLEYTYANTGMMEAVNPKSTKEERYCSIAYALEDIDNDGSTEMIVLDTMGNTRILAIYALQNGQAVMTHEGWARSRLYRLSDGALYREGSSGAAYSIFEAYGQCWFTYPKDEDQMEVGFYYAADGSYDPSTAQEITADEYDAKQVELAQKITAFAVYDFN